MQQPGAQMMNSGYQMQQPGVQPMNAPYGEYGQEPVPKKKKGGRIFAIILSVVLVLGIAAGAAYWFLFRADNKSHVEETMDRFCASVEELDFSGMLGCMFTDDLMGVLESYMENLGVSFDTLQESLMSEIVDSADAEKLENMDADYRIVGEPVEITGEEFDTLTKTLKMMFITDVEKIIKADVELIMTSGEDTETTEMKLYFYCVEDKWYLLPEEMFESGALF